MGVGWWWRSPLLRLGPKRVRTREVARKGGMGTRTKRERAGSGMAGEGGQRLTGSRAGRSGERSELGTLVLSEGEIKALGRQFWEFHYAWGAVGGVDTVFNGANTPKQDMAAGLAGWTGANAIGDRGLQERTLVQVGQQYYHRVDKKVAAAWLPNSGLSEKAQQMVLRPKKQ